jgi:predicted dehydrogenase
MRKMRVLVVGCGSIGIRHLRNLALRRDAELAAADVSPNGEKAVKDLALGIEFFNSQDAAASWRPELTVVATPNHLHLEGAEKAFAAGSHVLCEKPLAESPESGRKMVAAAKKSGKILAVGFTERFRAAMAHIDSAVKNGELGKLIGGRALVGTYNTLICAKNPADRLNTFGNLIFDYTHELDLLTGFFGQHKRIECLGNSIAEKELRASPSLAAMLIEYESGAIVSVHMDYVQHPQRRILELFGDRKSMVYNFQTDTLETYDSGGQGWACETRIFYNVRDEQFQREHDDMIRAVRDGSRPKVTGEDGLISLELAEEAVGRLKTRCGKGRG